jgi:hypothetical protein
MVKEVLLSPIRLRQYVQLSDLGVRADDPSERPPSMQAMRECLLRHFNSELAHARQYLGRFS